MPRYLVGDDLGSLKVLNYLDKPEPTGSRVQLKNVYSSEDSLRGEKRVAVQSLATLDSDQGVLAATAFSNGNITLSNLRDDDTLDAVESWTEPKLKANRFVGIAITDSSAISCTSNGALRRVNFNKSQDQEGSLVQNVRAIPTRLCDWKLSSSGDTFAYGGEEVALSVWDTKNAFEMQSQTEAATTSKRKRGEALFPGEVWRAKNPPNDSLSLRQPTRITALDFLPRSSRELVTGSQSGDVQRFDTRASRRPIGDWKAVGTGGIRSLKTGYNEHEMFVSDNGSNLYSLDMRTGRILYGYHGIAGSVSCIGPSPELLVSGALDQYLRFHSMTAPPADKKERVESKGNTLEKHFMQATPTVIIWDGRAEPTSGNDELENVEDPGDEVWDELEAASDDEADFAPKAKRRLTSKKLI